MLDFPASAAALWRIYDTTGIRPEYAIASLASESGLNPGADNGAGYYGVNQINSGFLTSLGIDPSSYKSWPASEQLSRVVLPFWQGVIRSTGVVPASGARMEQMNFLPATMRTATQPGSVVTAAPSAFYRDNAGAFDPTRKGFITVADIAAFVNRSRAKMTDAIAQAYAYRPGESPRDPVYGTDFGGGDPWPWIAVGALSAAAITATYAMRQGLIRRPRWF